MAALTENDILDIVYALKEGDDDGWETDSDEYLAGRRYCNSAIFRWEQYDNTVWNELWTTLTDAADGTKTITAGTYNYSCPTNMKHPSSWVRTYDGVTSVFWKVVNPRELGENANNNTDRFCYFTGSVKDGFTLNFNPNITLNTGDTINYEYYRQATTFTATTSTTEMSNPYFIVYSVLGQFIKLDGEDNLQELQNAEEALENMRVANEIGLYGVPNAISEPFNINDGFGQ